mgnify:FL=1
MKRSVLLAVMAVVLLPGIAICEGKGKSPKVFRDGGTIPDPVFRQYVLDNFDTDRDGRISRAEAEAVTEIRLPMKWDDAMQGKSFTSLEGIQHFPNLRTLVCAANDISTLDLSQNKDLEELECAATKITRLDLSQNSKLKKLTTGAADETGYHKDDLAELILPNPSALEELDCGGHKLTSLDLSGQPRLKTVSCSFCSELTSLDLNGLERLEKLYCEFNDKLTQLDFSGTGSLKILWCSCNKLLTSLDISCCPRLTELDVRANKLSDLNLRNNPQLEKLHCGFNQIRKLDISVCPGIRKVYCMMNPLYDFNFSGTRLNELSINANEVMTWNYAGAAEPERVTIYDTNEKSWDIDNLLERLEKIKAREAEEKKQREDKAEQQKASAEQRRAESQHKAAEYKRQIMPYITHNDWEGADKFAAEALTELPDGDAFLYCIRAKAYYLNNLDFEVGDDENMTDYFRAYRSEAEHLVELCRKSIACDPSDGNEAYFYRGLAYVVLGRANDAASDFKSCARGNEPFKASCYYNTGIAYKNAGWHSSALDQFKLARQYYTCLLYTSPSPRDCS